ncbi:MAG: alpha/beta hydrolase [Clostridiales bacterium]|nr:alpha/beta hydrolase [Clostridiales bacterium]
MKISEFSFKSATGVCDIYARRFLPDNEQVQAVIVMHHGMAEHSDRYLEFFEFLTSKGYAVYMHDMANHGKSNQNAAETGYFGDRGGYNALLFDFKTVFETAKKEYPTKKIIICGHSMGSFIARCFTAKYAKDGISGAIYIGTGGSNPAAAVGDFVSRSIAKIKGAKYKSKTLDKLIFGSYNSKFEKRTACDWLSTDSASNDKFIADPMCGFLFSAAGINDLIKLNISANSKEWYAAIPKSLPVLLISGDMDPVGAYGKGIVEINNKLKESAHTNVTMKLYKGLRHEILNEPSKGEIFCDFDTFIRSNVLRSDD